MNNLNCKKEYEIWTLDEYDKFIKELKSDSMYYNAFQLLYMGGLRVGELLALTVADIDLLKKTIRINKSYQRSVEGYCIKTPLTPNRIRTVKIPEDLICELKEYMNNFNDIEKTARIFPITPVALSRTLEKVSEKSESEENYSFRIAQICFYQCNNQEYQLLYGNRILKKWILG